MAARRQWVPIAVGVVILLLFVAAGAIWVSVSYVREQLQVETATSTDADRAFAEVRARFGNRPPLLELKDGRPVYREQREAQPGAEGSRTSLDALHVLAYDPDEGRLARFSLPFWFLRLKSGPIEFSAYASGLDDRGVDLRPEEIERYGPGIVLDHTSPAGERVLLWAQ